MRNKNTAKLKVMLLCQFRKFKRSQQLVFSPDSSETHLVNPIFRD